MRTIHDEMQEEVDLAFTYAKDGAPASAARIFRKIADKYQARADAIAEKVGLPVEKTYTAFCRDVYDECTTWIEAVTALDLEQAKKAAIGACAAAWECSLNSVECIGLATGDVDVAWWDDDA